MTPFSNAVRLRYFSFPLRPPSILLAHSIRFHICSVISLFRSVIQSSIAQSISRRLCLLIDGCAIKTLCYDKSQECLMDSELRAKKAHKVSKQQCTNPYELLRRTNKRNLVQVQFECHRKCNAKHRSIKLIPTDCISEMMSTLRDDSRNYVNMRFSPGGSDDDALHPMVAK